MPFRHVISIITEGPYQNWYGNKTLIQRDNHSDVRYSICFDLNDKHIVHCNDVTCEFCLQIPRGMWCRVELTYYEGEPYNIQITEMDQDEVAAEVAARGDSTHNHKHLGTGPGEAKNHQA